MRRRLTASLIAFTLCLAPELALAKKKGPAKSESDKALTLAKRDWQSLRGDAKHNKYRSNWLKVAARFEEVAKRFPKSDEAPKALFDAGELYEDLSRISWIQDDVDQAAQLYGRVAKEYAKSSLADDALLASARLYLTRKNDGERARAELKRLLKRHPSGDMAAEAQKLLATLPADEKPAKKREAAKKEEAKPAESKPAEAKKEEAKKAVAEAAPAEEPKPAQPEKKHKRRKKAEEAPAKPAEESPAAVAERKPMPIVPAAEIDGSLPEAPAEPAEADDESRGDAAQPKAKLYQPSEIVPRVRPEHLDKDKLAALRSAVRTSAELPLSAQMGLKVRRVVVDAGHGGHDTGAIGPTGIREKDASLAVAKKLAEKLRAQGLEVLLTRSDDKFVPLEGRAAFANDNRADLFISVHCNAAENAKLHGVETYSLNVSSNQYAMRLAARENAASERSISDLQLLLADLTTKANTADSRRLARTVQSSVAGGLRTKYDAVRDLGTKEALFYVLLGTRMPAILVEGAFISNPAEEKRLADPEFQEQLAGSIAAGVSRFVEDRQSLSGMPVATLP